MTGQAGLPQAVSMKRGCLPYYCSADGIGRQFMRAFRPGVTVAEIATDVEAVNSGQKQE